MLKLLNPIAGLASDLIEVASSALGSGFLAEFARSESGEVCPKQGFPVAWTGGLLIAAMVVLGSSAQPAAACPSHATSGCSSNAQCTYYCYIAHGCTSGHCCTSSDGSTHCDCS